MLLHGPEKWVQYESCALYVLDELRNWRDRERERAFQTNDHDGVSKSNVPLFLIANDECRFVVCLVISPPVFKLIIINLILPRMYLRGLSHAPSIRSRKTSNVVVQ